MIRRWLARLGLGRVPRGKVPDAGRLASAMPRVFGTSPPPDWPGARIEPPEHWLERVRRNAPGLLSDHDRSGARNAGPASDSPSGAETSMYSPASNQGEPPSPASPEKRLPTWRHRLTDIRRRASRRLLSDDDRAQIAETVGAGSFLPATTYIEQVDVGSENEARAREVPVKGSRAATSGSEPGEAPSRPLVPGGQAGNDASPPTAQTLPDSGVRPRTALETARTRPEGPTSREPSQACASRHASPPQAVTPADAEGTPPARKLDRLREATEASVLRRDQPSSAARPPLASVDGPGRPRPSAAFHRRPSRPIGRPPEAARLERIANASYGTDADRHGPTAGKTRNSDPRTDLLNETTESAPASSWDGPPPPLVDRWPTLPDLAVLRYRSGGTPGVDDYGRRRRLALEQRGEPWNA
jgi:hypothetical protein